MTKKLCTNIELNTNSATIESNNNSNSVEEKNNKREIVVCEGKSSYNIKKTCIGEEELILPSKNVSVATVLQESINNELQTNDVKYCNDENIEKLDSFDFNFSQSLQDLSQCYNEHLDCSYKSCKNHKCEESTYPKYDNLTSSDVLDIETLKFPFLENLNPYEDALFNLLVHGSIFKNLVGHVSNVTNSFVREKIFEYKTKQNRNNRNICATMNINSIARHGNSQYYFSDETINVFFAILQNRNRILFEMNSDVDYKCYFFKLDFIAKLCNTQISKFPNGFNPLERSIIRMISICPDSNIFQSKKIYIPMIWNNHFTLFVIKFEIQTIEYYDSLHKYSSSRRIFKTLIKFLQHEWKKNYPTINFNSALWSCKNMKSGPNQGGTYNCGVYTFLHAAYDSLYDKLNFTVVEGSNARKKLLIYIFQYGLPMQILVSKTKPSLCTPYLNHEKKILSNISSNLATTWNGCVEGIQ